MCQFNTFSILSQSVFLLLCLYLPVVSKFARGVFSVARQFFIHYFFLPRAAITEPAQNESIKSQSPSARRVHVQYTIPFDAKPGSTPVHSLPICSPPSCSLFFLQFSHPLSSLFHSFSLLVSLLLSSHTPAPTIFFFSIALVIALRRHPLCLYCSSSRSEIMPCSLKWISTVRAVPR